LATATSALNSATSAYNLAFTALNTEKARTSELTAKLKTALAAYTAAQKVVADLQKLKK
jgi:hypothetical protein